MHEILLFCSVPTQQHNELLQQLAGLTAMQPRRRIERHLVFKAHGKPGQITTRVGGTQDLQGSEMQRLTKMLNGGMYYTQVVGPVNESDFGSASPSTSSSQDVAMQGVAEAPPGDNTTTTRPAYDFDNQNWRLEFRDIPEAGTRTAVTARLMANATLPSGDVLTPMNAWGYSFVTEYVLEGDVFIHGDIVIFMHRVLTFPVDNHPSSSVRRSLPPLRSLSPLDPTGSYILQATVIVQEGSNPQMMKTATQLLFSFREQMKSAVKLEQADRLSLDTRVK